MKKTEIQEVSNFLLDYSVNLLRSGANTERTVRNVSRIGKAFGYETVLAIFQRNITMTIFDPLDHSIRRTYVKQQLPPHLSLANINDLSALSWETVDENLSIEELQEKYKEILDRAHKVGFIVTILAAIATGAFCKLLGGDVLAFIIVTLSTIVSFSMRLYLLRLNVDIRLMMMSVSFIASTLTWFLGTYLIPTHELEIAISASVLFLIPGVHIINSVTDVLDGHVIVGIARTINASILVACIALGLYFSIMLTRGIIY